MTTEFRSKSVTVMFADVVESVRLIEQDEARNVARIAGLLDLLAYTLAPRFDADVLERRGDGLLMTFADSRQGAACAHAFHMAAAEQALHGAEEALMLRVGLHTADVLADGRTIYGRGANLAARITALAKPGETLSSSETRSMLTDDVDACISDLGECFVKNRIEPVRVYRLDTLGASDRAPGPAQLAPPDDPRVSLAVLPFADHAALSRSDDLNVGDVATEQFTQAMSRSPQVRVISRLSANAFRGRLGDLPGIAEKLGVHYVVRGSVDRTSERRVRLTLELVQMRTRSVIWQGSAEGPESEAGQADSDLIGGPIAELSETLIGVEVRAARVMPLPNLATHTLMMAAIAMMHRFSRADFDRSRQLLELLVDRVPRHPGPMAWLARWHVFRVVQKWSDNSHQDASRAMSLAGALTHEFEAP